jgi:methylglutaconyl-CoA hydratase
LDVDASRITDAKIQKEVFIQKHVTLKHMNQGTIQKQIRDGIARVEFYHPQGNSFPSLQLKKLETAIKELGARIDIQVIVLQSDPKGAFCGGASFNELREIKNKEAGKQFFMGFANLINAMRKCPKIIIGRIHGKAVGGGVGLAAACDYCLSTESASIKLSELAIGLGPFVIAPAIKRKMGLAALSELTLAPSEWKTAYWAQGKGLFARVYESFHELETEVDLMANRLARYNPLALSAMKKIFWEGTDHWDTLLAERASISGELVLSDATLQALSKTKE